MYQQLATTNQPFSRSRRLQ